MPLFGDIREQILLLSSSNVEYPKDLLVIVHDQHRGTGDIDFDGWSNTSRTLHVNTFGEKGFSRSVMLASTAL